ncbi:cyclase family protein [Phenylobacterium sp.]|jgi:kynurenine formamidase|uniref:cyclase family protein n=1 Tax=Phenylobacterium sp. TaxID=1871053 RepID=UPI002F3E6C04
MKRTDFDAVAERVRNWGRWGPEDQRGTLNHIGPEVLKAASETVLSGKLFSLGLNFDSNGPQLGARRFNPKLYPIDLFTPLNPERPAFVYADDVIHMPLQAATQWDALSHVHYDGLLYNGCKACDVLSPRGAAKLGVEHMANPGIMSRGVLLDIARLKGVDALPTEHAITPDDLDAACAAQGVQPKAGDILLVRTGHIRRFTIEGDRAAFNGHQPGLHHACAEWVHDRSLAAVCADNLAVEIMGAGRRDSEVPLPFHMLCLRDMGLPLGEMFNLEALAADCAQDGRYAFLLAASPLAFTNAVGSPVNPLVLK